MPLSLREPRPGKTPSYYIRGTYLGVRIDRTTGTADRATARKALARVKADIERGAFAPKQALSFAAAALSYIRAGGEALFMAPLNDHFGDTALIDIDQAAIDAAAHTLYPNASPATRNRQVYTPVSAVLKHASYDFKLRRPKGAQGQTRVDWLWPEEANALFEAAGKVDAEFRLFLILLTYCGPRLSEALRIRIGDVRRDESFVFIGKTKNGEPRPVHLPPVVIAELEAFADRFDKPADTLFRFRKNGALYHLMKETRARAAHQARELPHPAPHLGHLDAPLRWPRHQGPRRHRRLGRPEVRRPLRARRRQRGIAARRPAARHRQKSLIWGMDGDPVRSLNRINDLPRSW
jgi:integrase